jgi:hypothetical protein
MNILVEAVRIFEGVATSVADQAQDGLGQAPVPIGGDSEHHVNARRARPGWRRYCRYPSSDRSPKVIHPSTIPFPGRSTAGSMARQLLTRSGTITDWTPPIARSLGNFLGTLHRVDPTGGPEPGPHTFFRGAPVTVYADETAAAIGALDTEIDRAAVEKVWDTATATQWAADPQWFHGDPRRQPSHPRWTTHRRYRLRHQRHRRSRLRLRHRMD